MLFYSRDDQDLKSSVGFYSTIKSIISWITAAIRYVSGVILAEIPAKCSRSGNVPRVELHDSAAGPGQHTLTRRHPTLQADSKD